MKEVKKIQHQQYLSIPSVLTSLKDSPNLFYNSTRNKQIKFEIFK